MTFATPWGNYRYKRLAFGGKNSQDLFDAEIAKIISGIPRVLNNRDDIMVGGRDWEEHNQNLETLLERLTVHNLTLRKEKCEFCQTSIEFHGHYFTNEGPCPSPGKIRAIQEIERLKNKEELVSFIQMMAYLSRFIENFSSRSEPLRRLTKQGQPLIRVESRATRCIWRSETCNLYSTCTNIISSGKKNLNNL